MSVNSRIPASVGNAAFIPIDGNVGVTVFPGDAPGIFSSDDNTSAIGYGILALKAKYRYPLDLSKVYQKYGLRPEWWQAALIRCAREYMLVRRHPIPQLVFPQVDRKANQALWIRNQIMSCGDQLPDFVGSLLRNLPPGTSHKTVIATYKMLQDLFDQATPESKPTPQASNIPARDPSDMNTEIDRMMDRGFTHATGQWGRMKIVRPPLEKQIRNAINALRPRPGFTGAFRYPLRAAIPAMDGRAFGQRRKVAGGTLLIDASGSMHITPQEIEALIERRPAATIAIYSAEGKIGTLAIVGAKGRSVTKINNYGGLNVIDGPALEWLGKQKRPRIWISDGCATGLDDQFYANLSIEAVALQKKHKIRRVNSIPEYMAQSDAQLRRTNQCRP